MSQRFKNWIKRSEILGKGYFVVVLILIKIMQIFIRPQQKRILFMSYSGRQFSDSPKEAYFALKADPQFADYELVWAFNHPEKFPQIEDKYKVSSNSPLFFIELLKSKYWIANSSIERLVPFSHPKHIYIQFWHGIPMKTLGRDEKQLPPLVRYWYNHAQFDYLFTYSDYDTEKFKKIFPKTKHILKIGQLRNNMIAYHLKKDKALLREELGIQSDKPVLLYVPTFRSYHPTVATNFSVGFLDQLAQKYTILYRGHYFDRDAKKKDMELVNTKSIYKLFAVADILITDYSSAIFDFAPLNKPIYLFQPDIAEYQLKRGLYLTGEDTGLPVAYSEQELWQLLDEPYEKERVIELTNKYNPGSSDKALGTLKAIIETAQ